MARDYCKYLLTFTFAMAAVLTNYGTANAQIQAAGGGYYVAGYGRVYGSFGQASAAQSGLWEKMKTQQAKQQSAASRPASPGGRTAELPQRAARNLGAFRPDATVDTGKTLADSLADTPAEKDLIKQIYAVAKAAYDDEAASRGWKNNIAGGLTFFTVVAITVYHDGGEPGEEAVTAYFRNVNAALDEIPEYERVTNKEKLGFNNMLIGFGGIMLAGYTDAKERSDPSALATSKKLAGMLIEMVLKTDPENLRIENGQIVMK